MALDVMTKWACHIDLISLCSVTCKWEYEWNILIATCVEIVLNEVNSQDNGVDLNRHFWVVVGRSKLLL